MLYLCFLAETFQRCCTHFCSGLVQNKAKIILRTYGKIMGRCRCKQNRYAQSQSLPYITAPVHLCMYATLCMSFSQTQRELKGEDERSIYLLTDVMNISAWPTLLPWYITAVCLSSLFFAYYSRRENPQICLRCIFHSPFHYLLRLIRAMVSAVAWSAKLCLIG